MVYSLHTHPYLLGHRSITTDQAVGEGKMAGEALLHRLHDGSFQIVQPGDMYPILDGYDYLLIDRGLAKALRELAPDSISSQSASITRASTGEHYTEYMEVSIHHQLEYKDYGEANAEGNKLWLMMGSYIYVSPSIREAMSTLVKTKYQELDFKLGRPTIPGKSMMRI